MATINNKLIHFKSKSDFDGRYAESTDSGKTYGDFLGTSIVFIQDAKQIWTHGQFYDANETTLASLGITATAAELNKLDGVTATTQELNYVDGVTSNIQTQLNGKAATSHNHNASNINAGTLDIARIPTGTSASTVALGNHTHSEYAASSHTHGTDDVTALTGYTEGTSTTTLTSAMSLNAALASLQNQIQDKASSSSLDNYALKTEIPTNISSFTNDSGYITNSVLSDYALKTEIPDISDLATKTELAGYLPLTGGTLSGALTLENNATLSVSGDSSLHYVEVFGELVVDQGDLIINTGKIYSQGDDSQLILSAGKTGYGTVQLQGGQNIVSLDQGGFKYNSSKILTEEDVVSDAHLKAGTSNNIAIKLFLVGGKEQNNNGELTYSQAAVYMQNNQLYASRMNATNGFYETSDGTLKNIKSELNIADNIDKIPTVLFSWKKDEPEDINQDVPVHIGTIAQDIQKIYPDLVAENAEGHLTVDYARLSVVAIAAIKELKKEIEILKSKIN